MKLKTSFSYFCLFTFTFFLFTSVSAQTLSVKEIMKEPSIAGMRVEGERLSPDGKHVVYLWNAEGKEPRDLYLVSTSDGDTKKILSPSDLLTKKDEKEKDDSLEYGVVVNDDFIKSQRNGIGNLRWSPDSSKILFTQNGDVFVLNLNTSEETQKSLEKKWLELEKLFQERIEISNNIINRIKQLDIQEPDFFGKIKTTSSLLLNLLNEESKNRSQRKAILQTDADLSELLEKIEQLKLNYPSLQSDSSFTDFSVLFRGNDNRINAYKSDYQWMMKEYSPNPKRITKTESFEFSAEFLDNDRILFQQSGNLFSIDTKNGTLTQISKEANSGRNISVFGDTHSKNGEMIAYITSDGSNQKPLFVPNYLPLYTSAPTTRRGWTKPTVYVAKTDGSFEKSIEIELPKQEDEAYIAGMEWLADNKTLLIDRVDKTHKRRQIFAATFDKNNKANVFQVFEEIDEKWIGSPARILEANPKNADQFFFSSERNNGSNHPYLTGYNHLYLVDLERSKFEDGIANAEIKQMTFGPYEVDWAKWHPKPEKYIRFNSKNPEQVIFTSTRYGSEVREFSIVPTNAEEIFVTGKAISKEVLGMIDSPQIAVTPDANSPFLLYRYSKWNQPTELLTDDFCISCSIPRKLDYPIKLTSTTPKAFLKRKWNEPKFVEINSRDNKKIPAKMYFPANFDKSKKSPMVIFVHGAGYLQNVIDGWNNYYREFMFNQLLTQKGYVVLDIDYRGSAGYGRDWRTDVYDFLGGKDYEDHVDSIDFMVKEYNVDQTRIGVYGGSYGGFMAAMLVMRSPDKIQAAAALRPVMDWKNYYAANPFYTSQRLGDPKKNAEAYKRSSPIAYAKDLRKQLLILHGLLDDNVHAQDSIQLVEQLIRLDKTEYFELMVYPAERHSFQRPSSWEDEYERILELFETELK